MKNKIRAVILFSVLLMLVMPSCTIQKRKYFSGYNTEWNRLFSKNTSEPIKEELNRPGAESVTEPDLNTSDESNFTASTNDEIIVIANERSATKNAFIDDKCDVITLKNGERVEGKVTEITLTEVKYKKCANLEGPTISIAKSDVHMIEYPNGTKDIINANNETIKKKTEDVDYVNPNPTPKTAEVKKRVEPFGLIGYILSLIGIFIGGIILGGIGVVFGFISLNKIKKHPEKYKSKKLYAILSIIIGSVAFFAGVLFLLIVI